MGTVSQVSWSRDIAIAAACIALNLAAGKVANLLSLPIYLDSAGTVIAAALLSPILAAAVGVSTALLGAVVINPVYAFYAGTQLAIAITAVVMLRIGGFRRVWWAILVGIVIAIVAAIVSAPVTVLLFGGVTVPGTTAINAVLIASGQNLWTAVITGSLLVETADKVTAVVLAWLVVQRLPQRLRANPQR
jgi:energy-coupling factor transport system substrate-specific component